jgi:hypothetical protein
MFSSRLVTEIFQHDHTSCYLSYGYCAMRWLAKGDTEVGYIAGRVWVYAKLQIVFFNQGLNTGRTVPFDLGYGYIVAWLRIGIDSVARSIAYVNRSSYSNRLQAVFCRWDCMVKTLPMVETGLLMEKRKRLYIIDGHNS